MQFVFFSGCRCKRRYLGVSCKSTENRYTTWLNWSFKILKWLGWCGAVIMKPRRIETDCCLDVAGDHSATIMSFEWAIVFDSLSLSPHTSLCSYWEAKEWAFRKIDHHGQWNGCKWSSYNDHSMGLYHSFQIFCWTLSKRPLRDGLISRSILRVSEVAKNPHTGSIYYPHQNSGAASVLTRNHELPA